MEQGTKATWLFAVIGIFLSAATVYVGYQTRETNDAVRQIEQSRLDRERRDAEVADFVGTFYAAQCDQQIEMERFPLRRWVGIQTPVDRDYVQAACDQARGDEPTRIIERLNVVGRLGAGEVRVFATIRWAKDGRPINDTGELSYIDILLERMPSRSQYPYAVRSVAEVRAHAS